MKIHISLIAASLIAAVSAAETPKIFAGLLQPGVAKRAQIGMVVPPQEIDKYLVKVEAAARKDPKWFSEFSSASKPGLPLPYDERIGLTKEEYAEYLALWNKRDFKSLEDVTLMLRESTSGTWVITSTGGASTLTTLRYVEKEDVFRSPNGVLKRIEDINADPASILGAWSGNEWKFEDETGLGKTKENFALGRYADKKYGLVVYRVQELSTEGTRLLDRSLVIRLALDQAASTTTPPVKAAPKKKN